MTGNKKLHFQALIRTGYVKKGGTAYVKRNFNHPMYRSGLYEPDIYSHDFVLYVKFRPKSHGPEGAGTLTCSVWY